jgi:uncharacterized lipoprotein YajG
MKKLMTLCLATLLIMGCATQQHSSKGNANCGSKQQKKAKYNSMKRGTSPGGGMLH